jgi:hypothetical protein
VSSRRRHEARLTTLPAVRDGRVHESDVFGVTAGNNHNPTLLNVPWQLDRQRAVLERVSTSGSN